MVHPDYAILIIALTGHVSIVYLTPLNLLSLCGYILSATVQLKYQNLVANKMDYYDVSHSQPGVHILKAEMHLP